MTFLLPPGIKGLKILAQKYPNKVFLVPNLDISIFPWNLDKFKGADFKYDNSFLKSLTQKYPNKAFLVPDLGRPQI